MATLLCKKPRGGWNTPSCNRPATWEVHLPEDANLPHDWETSRYVCDYHKWASTPWAKGNGATFTKIKP